MSAAEKIEAAISPPLSWAEIQEQYPDRFVCLVAVDRVHPRGLEIRSARIAGSGKDRREAFEQASRSWFQLGKITFAYTGESPTPYVRPPEGSYEPACNDALHP